MLVTVAYKSLTSLSSDITHNLKFLIKASLENPRFAGRSWGNNGFLLIETGTAVQHCIDSPAAHANLILIGIVTGGDNHSSDELFSRGAYKFEYGDEVT